MLEKRQKSRCFPLPNINKLVGVRHVVCEEPNDDFMLQPEFRRGIAALEEFGLAYDLLVFPRQLPAAAKLAAEVPRQTFVLNHLGRPAIRDREMTPWREDLQALARCDNVYCKLSGLANEAVGSGGNRLSSGLTWTLPWRRSVRGG